MEALKTRFDKREATVSLKVPNISQTTDPQASSTGHVPQGIRVHTDRSSAEPCANLQWTSAHLLHLNAVRSTACCCRFASGPLEIVVAHLGLGQVWHWLQLSSGVRKGTICTCPSSDEIQKPPASAEKDIGILWTAPISHIFFLL